MDKTLLRPLFQKRYMQLNKPQGFRTGAAIDFKQIAMGNQRKQPNNDQGIMQIEPKNDQGILQVANLMPDASAPVIDVQRRELPEPGILNALKQGFDESNEQTRIKKNVKAINQGRKQGETIEDLNQEVDQAQEQEHSEFLKFLEKQGDPQPQQPQAQATRKKTSDASGLFSDSEKTAIFAGLLARGIGQPGNFFDNLGPALGGAAMGLADLKATEAELAKAKATGKPFEVYDPNAKQNVLIRPENFIEGFHQPAKAKEKADDYVEKYDRKLETLVSVKKSELGATMSPEDKTARYINIPKMIDVIANTDLPEFGLKAGEGKPIPVFEYFANRNKFRSKDPDDIAEKVAFEFQKRQEKAKSDRIDESNESMLGALTVARLADSIKKDIFAGAKTGMAGDIVQFANSSRALITEFLNPIRNSPSKTVASDFTRMERELNNLIANPNRASGIYKDGVVKFVSKISKLTGSARSAMIDLAYTLAKAREPGGRFSTTDIELAMATLGEQTDPKQMLFVLRRVAKRGIQQAIDRHSYYTGKAESDFDPLFQEVIKARDELGGSGEAIFDEIEDKNNNNNNNNGGPSPLPPIP